MNLRQWAKFLVYQYCPGMAGRFRYFACQVYFPIGNPVFRIVCEQGMFEPEIIRALIHYARPNTSIFDVGANIGLMAIPILHSCSGARVVSFEPSPNSLPFLTRTAAESPYGDRWEVIPKGVSKECGEAEFTVGRIEDALFEGFNSKERISNVRDVRVQVTTLDEEWRRLGKPAVSVIKIDVEGGEGLVLEGSRKLLETARPYVVLEWYKAYLEPFGTNPQLLLSIAKELGYRIYSIPTGVPITDEQQLDLQMLNCSNFLLAPN